MSNDEKKFSLDDLPDEGSSSVLKQSSPKKDPPKKNDPRVEKIKRFDDEKKVEEMTRKWFFDRPERNHGWMAAILVLVLLEIADLEQYLERPGDGLSYDIFSAFASIISPFIYVLKHPFILIILIPVFYKFNRRSDFYFELNFDGIHTVQKTLLHKGEQAQRVRIKWGEIARVEKRVINEREVLEIFSPAGKIGELIWDIEDHKKIAVRQLVKGLLPQKNPLREFIEKEVT